MKRMTPIEIAQNSESDSGAALDGAHGSESSGQPCRLCEAKGWRWVLRNFSAPWLERIVCCDCEGTGVRPVIPNAEVGHTADRKD